MLSLAVIDYLTIYNVYQEKESPIIKVLSLF